MTQIDSTAADAHQVMVLVTDDIERAAIRESTDSESIRSFLNQIAGKYYQEFTSTGSRVMS
jgi:hypothetical protein